MAYRWVEHSTNEFPILTSVTCAVVLIMENAPQRRRRRIAKVLHTYPICKHVIFQYNKGYRKVKKDGVDNSSKDILHATAAACQYARGYGATSVLVLEDDVDFRPSIFDHGCHIDAFVSSARNVWDIYSLGSMITFTRPFQCGRHVRVPQMGGAHAWIFHADTCRRLADRQFIHRVHSIMNQRKTTKDFALSSICTCFVYYRSVANQTHPDTENAGLWMNPAIRFAIRSMMNAHNDGTVLYDTMSATLFGGGLYTTLVGFAVLAYVCMTHV